MTRYLIVSLISGILFVVLDMAINANPLARRLFEAFKPIAKTTINPIAGILIDLIYGFAMAGIFLLLYDSLPGTCGILKGLSYAGILWFFRVVMNAASQYMMFKIPVKTLIYSLVAGLIEMLVLGMLYGIALKPIL